MFVAILHHRNELDKVLTKQETLFNLWRELGKLGLTPELQDTCNLEPTSLEIQWLNDKSDGVIFNERS